MAEPKKILLIEDDEYIRDVYKDILAASGFNVSTASDGEQGLMKLGASVYDLVFLDVMMPKLDGLGVLKDLREKKIETKGKIVLLTNLSHDPVIQEALALGADGYIIKNDINPDQLVEKANHYLAS